MSTGSGPPGVRALLVVESVFGNTAAIGRAIAEGLGEHATVDVVAVGAAPADLPEGVDLLVVGAPTHAFTLSRPGSRQDARMRREIRRADERTHPEATTTARVGGAGGGADDDSGDRPDPGTARAAREGDHTDGARERALEPDAADDGTGVREWLGGLPARARTVAAATFDTKISRPRLPGSAAAAIAKRLRRLGFRLVARPRSFYVAGTEGPLVHGEIERAREWGAQVGAASLRLEQPR